VGERWFSQPPKAQFAQNRSGTPYRFCIVLFVPMKQGSDLERLDLPIGQAPSAEGEHSLARVNSQAKGQKGDACQP